MKLREKPRFSSSLQSYFSRRRDLAGKSIEDASRPRSFERRRLPPCRRCSPFVVSAAYDCRGNNSRPELQEPGESGGRGRARAGCGVTLISHSALTRKERNTIINALVGGKGRKRNTLINTEDVMILGEICPSCSSQHFKSLFILAKTSATGPPPLLFMIPVYYGLYSER